VEAWLVRLYEGRTLMTNPRKVTIYLAEKGIQLTRVGVDMRGGEGRGPEFRAKNPAGLVPVLELDDGQTLPESAAIIEYLEELHPDPPMIGRTPLERARTRALDRICNEFITTSGRVQVHTHPFFSIHRPGYMVQIPEVAKWSEGPRDRLIGLLEGYIGSSSFVAGDSVSIADCTLFAGLHVQATLFEYDLPETAPNLRAWYGRFLQRESAAYVPIPA